MSLFIFVAYPVIGAILAFYVGAGCRSAIVSLAIGFVVTLVWPLVIASCVIVIIGVCAMRGIAIRWNGRRV